MRAQGTTMMKRLASRRTLACPYYPTPQWARSFLTEAHAFGPAEVRYSQHHVDLPGQPPDDELL
jgi:hypothetical protein